jgi:hypothetical protein
MIVLDEQLLGRNLETEIGQWYQGAVRYIIDLRPNTIIKDDAIPKLLQQERQPTFVTINEGDFWHKIRPSNYYCIVCFTLSDSRVREISQSLRDLCQHPIFSSKAKRMGKIIRVTDQAVNYYTNNQEVVQVADFYS